VFCGTLSDYLGKRKSLAVIGYGLGTFAKPLFAIATTTGMVFSLLGAAGCTVLLA